MHPRIAEMLAHLDRQRAAIKTAVQSIPSDQRERRPAADRWSVAEILEHLALVERRLTNVVKTAITGARANGLRPETDVSPVLATVPAIFVDRSRKRTASEAVLPTGTLDSAAAWRLLESTRADLRTVVADADGFALGDVVHPHPVAGPLNMYQWIGFIGSHEARHAAQILEQA